MGFDGAHGQVQLSGDGGILFSLGDQRQDLVLPLGEGEQRAGGWAIEPLEAVECVGEGVVVAKALARHLTPEALPGHRHHDALVIVAAAARKVFEPHPAGLDEIGNLRIENGETAVYQVSPVVTEEVGEGGVAIADDAMRRIDHRHGNLFQREALMRVFSRAFGGSCILRHAV